MGSVKIQSVSPHSPAERAGILPGEILVSVSGKPIRDVFDYKFFTYDPTLTVEIKDENGVERSVKIKKDEGEDLGLDFSDYLMDKPQHCANKCLFCFIDQLPKGMRDTLYFKDDDHRMSLLLGNYITLTNLSEADISRIIEMHISPINISVQATDPEIRKKMLGSPRAGECMNIMKRFADAGISMGCQLVICPGINDGDVLHNSLADLTALYPAVSSISVVPVGLTCHREGLYPLKPFTKEDARATLSLADGFGKLCYEKYGSRIVFCADELYLKAELPIPDAEHYEDFAQLDNGVGMWALLKQEAEDYLNRNKHLIGEDFTLATGTAAGSLMPELLDEIAKKCDNKYEYNVCAVENRFFGSTVTVAGLVTGGDLLNALKNHPIKGRVLIPAVMLRRGEDVFLDDMTLDEFRREIGVPVITVPNDGAKLVSVIAHKPATMKVVISKKGRK